MKHIFVRTAEGETFKHHAEEALLDDDNGMLIIANKGKHVAGYQGSEWRSYHIPDESYDCFVLSDDATGRDR